MSLSERVVRIVATVVAATIIGLAMPAASAPAEGVVYAPAPQPPSSPAPTPEPPNTRLLGLRLNAGHGSATFVFAEHGVADGFQCALVRFAPKRGRRGRHRAHRRHRRRVHRGRAAPSRKKGKPKRQVVFSPCASPATLRGLKSGRYLFKVRAIGPGGWDHSPARSKFTIARRTHR